jgi:hypothetical protein
VTDSRLGVLAGSIAWVGVAAVYAAGLAIKGRTDLVRALLYNLPIAFLSLVVFACLLVKVARLGPARFLNAQGPTVVVWVVGLGVLYLRLVSKSLEVSGHLAWLPVLTVQSWLLGLPLWISVLGVAATASAAYLKFAVFQGPSGGPGLIVGLVLAMGLAITARARRRAVEQADAADEVRVG